MIVVKKPAGLALLVALSIGAPSGHLAGQEPRAPIDVLLSFVGEKVRTAVPPEMRPYDPPRMFLEVGRGAASGRSALGSLEKRNLERLGVTLVNDKADALVLDPEGSYVRDDGAYVVISSVDRVDHGALAITFSYYVTWRRTGQKSSICLEEWRIVQRPAGAGDTGWEIAEDTKMGHC